MINEFMILMRFEWVITLLIFLLLFIKLGKGLKNQTVLTVVYTILIINLFIGFAGESDGNLFGNMFFSSKLIAAQKTILNLGVLLLLMVNHSWLRRQEHLPEYLILLFSSLLGMFLMISSNNLLLFYLALELSTIPIAAMANFDLARRTSSEAAMKMILSSAFSSGVLLFGISLIYGVTGVIDFAGIAASLHGNLSIEKTAYILFFAGLAFKLSVVPFHLWTADVYEGAPVATTSFLSVISKGSVAFILMKLVYKTFLPLGNTSIHMMIVLSMLTVVIGNLFAVRQKNLKRFMAFSSIAQVAFILVGVLAGKVTGISSVTYFLLIYVFSNLSAFGVISIISEATGKENIDDYRALYKNNKLLSWVMAIALFSLAGIPPTAGFFGKLYLIIGGAGKTPVWFIVFMVLNLVLSLYYYLRVVRAMFMDPNSQPIESVKISFISKAGLLICVIAIVLLGLFGSLYEHLQSLANTLY